MNNLYHDIDFGGEIMSDSFVFPQTPASQKIFQLNIHSDISLELKLFLMTKFLSLNNAYLFYTPPKYTSAIHVDGTSLHNRPALNFVLNEESIGVMKWYELKDGIPLPEADTTPHSTPYLHTTIDSVNIVGEHILKKLCLVHTGMFHNIVNDSETGRWCVSVRFDKNITFNDALSKLLSRELF